MYIEVYSQWYTKSGLLYPFVLLKKEVHRESCVLPDRTSKEGLSCSLMFSVPKSPTTLPCLMVSKGIREMIIRVATPSNEQCSKPLLVDYYR